nr:hypothetical protein Iba_chr06bCG13760 [Ipomoea batatas]
MSNINLHFILSSLRGRRQHQWLTRMIAGGLSSPPRRTPAIASNVKPPTMATPAVTGFFPYCSGDEHQSSEWRPPPRPKQRPFSPSSGQQSSGVHRWRSILEDSTPPPPSSARQRRSTMAVLPPPRDIAVPAAAASMASNVKPPTMATPAVTGFFPYCSGDEQQSSEWRPPPRPKQRPFSPSSGQQSSGVHRWRSILADSTPPPPSSARQRRSTMAVLPPPRDIAVPAAAASVAPIFLLG